MSWSLKSFFPVSGIFDKEAKLGCCRCMCLWQDPTRWRCRGWQDHAHIMCQQ
jgi:hypothetical protein